MNKHTITKITRTSLACPAQWEGETDLGEYIYIRYRNGMLRAGVAMNEKEFWNWDESLKPFYIFQEKVGNDWDGYADYNTVKERLKHLFNFPESECGLFNEE